MIPTRLNLLLPEKRKHLKHLIYLQFTKGILETLLFSVALTGIILLGGRFLLQEHFNNLATNLTTLNTGRMETNQAIADINATVENAYTLQKKYIVWTPLLETMLNALPESVTISEIEIEPKKNNLIIKGDAESRESLLLLESELQNLDMIKNATAPISSLTQKENISFTINATLSL